MNLRMGTGKQMGREMKNDRGWRGLDVQPSKGPKDGFRQSDDDVLDCNQDKIEKTHPRWMSKSSVIRSYVSCPF